VVDKLVWQYGLPQTFRVDNGQEFISTTLDTWPSPHGVKLEPARASVHRAPATQLARRRDAEGLRATRLAAACRPRRGLPPPSVRARRENGLTIAGAESLHTTLLPSK